MQKRTVRRQHEPTAKSWPRSSSASNARSPPQAWCLAVAAPLITRSLGPAARAQSCLTRAGHRPVVWAHEIPDAGISHRSTGPGPRSGTEAGDISPVFTALEHAAGDFTTLGTDPLLEYSSPPSDTFSKRLSTLAQNVYRRPGYRGRGASCGQALALGGPARIHGQDRHGAAELEGGASELARVPEAENPAARVPKPRRLRSARMALPDHRLDELSQVAASTGNDPALDMLLLRLHMETACRRGGALALVPSDLDPGQCLIRLHEKGETIRWQPVSPTLMAHLIAHGQSRGGLGSGQRLLRYASGRPISARRYDYLWERLGEHLPWVKTQQVSMHWIRHILSTIYVRVAMAVTGGQADLRPAESTTSPSLPLFAEPRETSQPPTGQSHCNRNPLHTATAHSYG